jgi:hypothetical protein
MAVSGGAGRWRVSVPLPRLFLVEPEVPGPACGSPRVGRSRLPASAETGVLIWLVQRPGGLLLVGFALLASMATDDQEPLKLYELPPPCRLVPSPAGAGRDARCLHAPARQQAAKRYAAADR